jgi:hypothetical protein
MQLKSETLLFVGKSFLAEKCGDIHNKKYMSIT